MDLKLTGKRVVAQNQDYSIAFTTADGYELRIESRFELSATGKEDLIVTPGDYGDASVTLQSLDQQRIASSIASDDGTLKVEFENGIRIFVDADESFEAWTLAGPNGIIALSEPGGGLTTWSEPATDP